MRKVVLLLFVGLTIGSCSTKPNASDLLRHMAVVTNYIDTVKFSKKLTYWLPTDTLSYFDSTDPNQADTLQCVNCTGVNNYLGDYANLITTEVKAKLDAAGYVQVNKNQNPDMKVYVAIVRNYNVYQSYSYYPYGYGYGYGYYGGYYGGYYPTYNVSDIADLYLVIFDLKHLYNGTPNQIWFADISDLVSSPDPNGQTTIESINQAFKQSPYLTR